MNTRKLAERIKHAAGHLLKLGWILPGIFSVLGFVSAGFGVAETFLGLTYRDWHWSRGMITVSVICASISILCISLAFREQRTTRIVNATFVLIAIQFLVYLLFPFDPKII